MTEHQLPVLMGEAPSKSGDRYYMFPLSGRVAETLCSIAGIPPIAGESRYGQWTWALYERFECMNLIERYPGAQGRGSSFPMDLARQRAAETMSPYDGRVIVLLGARLPKVLGLDGVGFYEWQSVRLDYYGEYIPGGSKWGPPGDVWSDEQHSLPRARVVVIPHPSGLNRLYNEVPERERAGAAMRDAMRMAASPTPLRIDHA